MMRAVKKMLGVLLAAAALSGCGETPSAGSFSRDENRPLKIIATVFPEYDWVKEILGSNPGGAELVLLERNGADLHNYQASASDIAEIAGCDIFIYVGGESDSWVREVLKNNPSKTRTDISLMDSLGDRLKTEEGEDEYDEHVWLSLKNAEVLCGVITEKLAEKDTEHAEIYRINNTRYIENLQELSNRYEAAAEEAETKTVLFADRFPFRYLTDDLGLTYYAAFPGCSAETEASFETVIFLAGKIDELSLPVILTIEGPMHTVAETVRMNTKNKDQKILTLNSMQSAGLRDSENGMTYCSVMEDNLAVLREALGLTAEQAVSGK